MLRLGGTRFMTSRSTMAVAPPSRRRRTLVLAAALTTTAGGAAIAYTRLPDHTMVGLQRQSTFWYRVVPVIADYYWQFAASSPKVKYQAWQRRGSVNDDDNESPKADSATLLRAQQLQDCHERHAPTMLQVMLDLKGLFVKLGQVLSVSALPLPEPYRVRFRTLQDQVEGHEEFTTIRRILEDEFQRPLEELFDSIDEIPCGAASIGQAHRATLRDTGEQVVIKVQYPDAAWQVPADIQCVGDLMRLCVWAGVLDGDAAKMSYTEFARQFISELDYTRERDNLQTIYESSLEPNVPYQKRGIVVPRVMPELCTPKVITMTYLPGAKLEEEARRQLALLGIDTTKRNIGQMLRDRAREATVDVNASEQALSNAEDDARLVVAPRLTLLTRISQFIGRTVGLDAILYSVRLAQKMALWTTAWTVSAIHLAAPVLPSTWNDWAESHKMAAQQAERLSLTASWIDGLFDVHGHQVFSVGLFNADPHPGNLLVLDKGYGMDPSTPVKKQTQQLGLIDFGQCKRLTSDEQRRLATLILSVANNETDDQVANALRSLNIQTKNDSTYFLAEFARLMFGPFQPHHMDHGWHRKLHELDRVVYFPTELSMVYRTSLLLRGLAISLQVNPSVAQQWRHHAEAAIQKAV